VACRASCPGSEHSARDRLLGDVVEAEVRELVRRRGLDPLVDADAVRALVAEVLADYDGWEASV
jgi:hypothetical protein